MGDVEDTDLAELLLLELTRAFSAFSARVAEDARSEPVLTALADLALFASIFGRDHPGAGSSSLGAAVRFALSAPELNAVADPGPEGWALHAARAWLDPVAERHRLRDVAIRHRVDESRRIVMTLGPPWRAEEVAHVKARVSGTDLPPLRPIMVDGTTTALYDLTHVVFYATDFGLVHRTGPLASTLARTAARASGELLGQEWAWDVGLELVLAARFLSSRWPTEAAGWLSALQPRGRDLLLGLRADPIRFVRTYHPMILTALALAQAAAERGRP